MTYHDKTPDLLTVTSVDLWSDIIAMEYPSPHILRLYIALFLKKNTVNVECLQLLGNHYKYMRTGYLATIFSKEHSQGGVLNATRVSSLNNDTPILVLMPKIAGKDQMVQEGEHRQKDTTKHLSPCNTVEKSPVKVWLITISLS